VKKPLDNAMACLEHETEVADRERMHQAILAMGFYPTVRIVKTRRTSMLGDLTICVDEVEHAGAFVEIERTVDGEESGAAVQEELDAFARSLGLDLERTTDTYDSLVRAALALVQSDLAVSRTSRTRRLTEAASSSGGRFGKASRYARVDARWRPDTAGRVRERRRQRAGSHRSAGSTPAGHERRAPRELERRLPRSK